MSQQEDSETDIWEYKSLEKKRKTSKSVSGTVAKKTCTRKPSKGHTSTSVTTTRTKQESGDVSVNVKTEEHNSLEAVTSQSPGKETSETDNASQGSFSGDFCPICQMPFSILMVQSQRWHLAECLDMPRDQCKECPHGLQCSSTIPNHYKKYSHTLLAHSRANSDTALLSLSQQAETSGETSLSYLPRQSSEVDNSILESSQDSSVSLSAFSNCSASPLSYDIRTPTKLKNGLLLLRSPGPEDFRKKKGWLSSTKNQKSLSSSQESKTELSSELSSTKTDSRGQLCEGGCIKTELSMDNDEEISYSPLSDFPAELEVSNGEASKALFSNGTLENENEDSMELFSDDLSSEDKLFTQFIDHFEANELVKGASSASSNAQLEAATSLVPSNHVAMSTSTNTADSISEKEVHGKSAISPCKSNIQSPQSIVLEQLRETLSSHNLHCKNMNDGTVHSEQPESPQSSPLQRSQRMAPLKGQSKAGQASCLKQLDIGVFFGLKPLKEKEKEPGSGPNKLGTTSNPTLGENSQQRRQKRNWRRKNNTDITTGTVEGTGPVDDSDVVGDQGQGQGGSRRWRKRRWNRNGEAGEMPRCPFYKKIPGTKFVVDAFCYGEIEGITAYFLTHFHSDHYGGLNKNSTVPIYCNRITGNLVKSKLKVAEQYVHILPMNTQVTVEGARVILLDANHCPGAAMLLFFLPDGQTILHTGDFRADPSMETYPELLNCRVQTLYLDTTYCSPQYTFPKQQEVVSFAARTAFELVTLSPRTLVVCGSYSVGKEKVFLALAEVLGSKVCLSRDKYNTMCCLESEQVRRFITTDWKAAQVHVLPMMQLNVGKLQDHLSRFSGQYERLVAFKPTGWTFSQQVESVEDIQPQISGNISIYGIPYSEHSSFLEMKRFVQWLRPLKIIPTVNNGSWNSRRAMEKCFREWLLEAKAN